MDDVVTSVHGQGWREHDLEGLFIRAVVEKKRNLRIGKKVGVPNRHFGDYVYQ